MAKVKRLHDPGDYKGAQFRIKKLWNEGLFRIIPHAEERMLQNQLDTNDIQHLIRYGNITSHSKPMNLWRYTIDGNSVDGQKMRCVVEINGTLIFVSAFKLRSRGV